MDRISNNQDCSINIESYLNLNYNFPQQLQYIGEVQQEEEQDGGFLAKSCIQESQILLQKMESNEAPGAPTTPSERGSTSQKKTSKEATAKYREKKKIYQNQLEQQVKSLEEQILKTQSQIKLVKDAVLVQLQNSIKSMHNTENAQIFNEIETCLPINIDQEQLVDIDKLNLLLNTLKFRIGPTGRERQAKIQYNFKNIVNTLFPSLIRYMLITATKSTDFFSQSASPTPTWSSELLSQMSLSTPQLESIHKYQLQLKSTHVEVMQNIQTLKKIKQKMKEKALLLDGAEDELRQGMSAVQCARWTLFCEKHKYRNEIGLDRGLRRERNGAASKIVQIQDEMEQLLQYKLGRKRVKRDETYLPEKIN